MSGPERIVDIYVGVRGELRGKLRIVLLFLGVESEVLQQDRLACPEALDRILRAHSERVAGYRHVAPKERRDPLAHGPKTKAVLDLAVRPAQMAGEDDAGTLGEQGVDRRQGGSNPGVVGHLAVRERDVEIDAHEDTLSGSVQVADGQLVHPAAVKPDPPPEGAQRRRR